MSQDKIWICDRCKRERRVSERRSVPKDWINLDYSYGSYAHTPAGSKNFSVELCERCSDELAHFLVLPPNNTTSDPI